MAAMIMREEETAKNAERTPGFSDAGVLKNCWTSVDSWQNTTASRLEEFAHAWMRLVRSSVERGATDTTAHSVRPRREVAAAPGRDVTMNLVLLGSSAGNHAQAAATEPVSCSKPSTTTKVDVPSPDWLAYCDKAS